MTGMLFNGLMHLISIPCPFEIKVALWLLGFLVESRASRADWYTRQDPGCLRWLMQCCTVPTGSLIPQDVGHICGRHGELIMLVLGESVISLVIGLDARQYQSLEEEDGDNYGRMLGATDGKGGGGLVFVPSMLEIMYPADYAIVALGVHMCYLLHALYFNSQPFHSIGHALRRSSLCGYLWMWLHLPLVCCLLVSAA